MDASYLAIILIAGVLAAGMALLAWGTTRGNKWGLNLSRRACPACGAQAPIIRKPTSLKQALWGGWTCSKCGQDIDKWGARYSASPEVITLWEGQMKGDGTRVSREVRLEGELAGPATSSDDFRNRFTLGIRLGLKRLDLVAPGRA